MGFLDSNIVKLGTKQITITGTATTGNYVAGAAGLFDCKNYGIAAVQVSGLSDGTQIVIQGGVSSSFKRGKMWLNVNIFPGYTEQVEYIVVNNNTFICDVSRFNQAGFYVRNGSGETVTLTVVLMTGGYSDMSVNSLYSAFENLFKGVGPKTTDTGISVNSGTLKTYNGLSYPYAALNIQRFPAVDISLYCYDAVTNVRLPIFNEKGELLNTITQGGTYYLCLSGVGSMIVSSNTTVSGATVNLTLQELTEKPNVFELRPEQNIFSGVVTLTEGQTEKRVAFTTADKHLFPFFKFFCVNAVYKNASHENVYKTTFKVSKFDFMENGYNMWINELVSVSNRYAVQTDWIKCTAQSMTLIFNFNAAEEGDLLYYEIRGIR